MDFLKVKILGQYKQLIQFNKSFLQFLKKIKKKNSNKELTQGFKS